MKFRTATLILVLFTSMVCFGDTPPPGEVKAKVLDGSGNAISSTSGALNVNVTNPGGGTQTVNQGTPNSGGANSWPVSGSLGRTWALLNSTDSVNVGNFPSAFGRTWSLSSSGDSVASVQSGAWTVAVSNFPATQPVSGSLGRTWTLNSGTDSVAISGSVTATNAANGTVGSATPTTATQIAGSDGTNLRVPKVSASGLISVDGSSVTQPVSGSVSVSNFPASQAVTGTVTANAGTNLNTSALALESGGHLASIDTKTPALGQALSASSVPVVLPAAQITAITPPTSIAVNNFPATQPVSGTVAVSSLPSIPAGANAIGSVSVSNFPATQPISAAALPLPTGASTDAHLTNVQSAPGTSATTAITIQGSASGVAIPITGSITASNPSIGANNTTAPTSSTSIGWSDGTGKLQVVSSSNPLPITGSISASNPSVGSTGSAIPSSATLIGGSDGTNLRAAKVSASGLVSVDGSAVTQPVSASSLPLPTGAATAANQTSGNEKSQIVDGSGNVITSTTRVGKQGLDVTLGSAAVPGVTAPAWTDVFGGVDPSGNAQQIQLDSSKNLKVTTVSSVLPTGAATSANQSTEISSLSTIATNSGTQATAANQTNVQSAVGTSATTALTVQGSASGVAMPISAASLPLPSGAATSALQTSGNALLSTIATNTGAQATDTTTTGTITAVNGNVSISGQGVYTTTFSITGTWSATLVIEGQTPDSNWTQIPINIITSSLPYQQMSSVTTNGTYSITGGGFTNIRVRASAFTSGTISVAIDGSLAQQTVVANITTPDLSVTGASAQTATVNNILTTTSGTAATYAAGFHSASVQVTSTGTGGTYIFEGSNDNVNFQTIPVYNQLILTGTPITSAITASASQLVYTFPITTNYVRLRIATAITGGSIQAFTKLSQTTWTPAVFTIGNATAANANVTATIASGTVTTVSSVTSVATDNLATNANVADLASTAKTATFTLAVTPASGAISYAAQINVTASSGTTPTMDCSILESLDGGTTYPKTVYTFERITGVLAAPLVSPLLRYGGSKLEYSCVIGGTTPSFTMAINRVGSSLNAAQHYNLFDRTMVPNTASSAGATWYTEGCSNGALIYSQSAESTNPTVTLQTSADGSNWANTSYTITPAAAGTFTVPVTISSKYARVITTTAGTGITYTYSELNCTGP